MDLFQLETFLAVAREGGFSRAAKKLFRTQPAISQTLTVGGLMLRAIWRWFRGLFSGT